MGPMCVRIPKINLGVVATHCGGLGAVPVFPTSKLTHTHTRILGQYTHLAPGPTRYDTADHPTVHVSADKPPKKSFTHVPKTHVA